MGPYLSVLRSLAYDPVPFDRAVESMLKIVAAEKVNERGNAQSLLVLFQLHFSGTRAPIEQRLSFIRHAVASNDENEQEVGVLALRAVLRAEFFDSALTYNFGARSRDFGYWPQAREEMEHWFIGSLDLASQLACEDDPVSDRVRKILAGQFRDLWRSAGVQGHLGEVCRRIRRKRFWADGLLVVWRTLNLGESHLGSESIALPRDLEKDMKPVNLAEEVQSILASPGGLIGESPETPENVASGNTGHISYELRMDRAKARAKSAGKGLAAEQATLITMLAELVRSNAYHLDSLGLGLAEGAEDPMGMWNYLADAVRTTERALRRSSVLGGFLRGLRDRNPMACSVLLDECVERDVLCEIYPALQSAAGILGEDVARLKRSVLLRMAPAQSYKQLAFGGAVNAIPPVDLKEFLLGVATMPEGHPVAIDILHMRLTRQEGSPDANLTETGRALLSRFPVGSEGDYSEANVLDIIDHALGVIAVRCLRGTEGAAIVRGLCRRMRGEAAVCQFPAYRYPSFLGGLFEAQPTETLDGFCGGDGEGLDLGIRVLRQVQPYRDLLTRVPDGDLVAWCDQQPTVRYPALARAIKITQPERDGEPLRWSTLALSLLKNAPEPAEVLREFVFQFRFPVGARRGPLGGFLEAHAKLLDDLHDFSHLPESIEQERRRVRDMIEVARQNSEVDWRREQRFE